MKKETQQAPRFAQRFLLCFLKDKLAEEVQGDLDEMYQFQLEKSGKRIANLNYWFQVINYLRPFALRHIKAPQTIYTAMYKNYFKVSLRIFARKPFYLLVNAVGLGIALSCCLAVYLMFAYNFEFDSFHDKEKQQNTYKIIARELSKTGDVIDRVDAPIPLGPEVAQDMPGVNKYTRFFMEGMTLIKDKNGFSEGVAFVDSSFFEMFDYPLLYGSYNYLKNKNYIFLTEELSRKLFGNQNPVGEDLLTYSRDNEDRLLTVGGVIRKFPDNNSFNFSALTRIEHYFRAYDVAPDDWSSWRAPSTFLELTSSLQLDNVRDQLAKYIPIRNKAKKDYKVKSYDLVPFHTKMRTHEVRSFNINLLVGREENLLLGLMAIMILLIACFNLTNTALALASQRLKEIGVRKAIGAARKQIFGQFIAETFLTMTMALMVSLVLSVWIVPEFSTLVQLDYNLNDLKGMNAIIMLVIILFLASLIAGIYPALYNSRLKPVALMNGGLKIKKTSWISRLLISFQLAVSVIFLISGILFFQNSEYQNQLDFSYDKDQLIAVNINGDEMYHLLENEISSYPSIKDLGATVSHTSHSTFEATVEVENQDYDVKAMDIGENYFQTMGFQLVEGRELDINSSTDKEHGILVNKSFLRETGIKKPFTTRVKLDEKNRTIVGVIEDHLDDIYGNREGEAFIFYPGDPEKYTRMIVKADAEDLLQVNEYLKNVWYDLFPNRIYSSRFQDDIALEDARYSNFVLGKIFLFLSILGGALSMAGIFAIAKLNVTRRTKEIGVRKVLGASIGQIINLVNREFVVLLLISSVLGGVLGAFLIDKLLDFAYEFRVPVGFIPIVVGIMIVFGIGFLTTSSTILGAATANPIKTLRDE